MAVTIIRFKAGPDFANTVKLTTEKGYYRFKDLEIGEYKIIFSKKYYDTIEKEFELYPNDSIKMNEQLRKTEDWIDEEAKAPPSLPKGEESGQITIVINSIFCKDSTILKTC